MKGVATPASSDPKDEAAPSAGPRRLRIALFLLAQASLIAAFGWWHQRPASQEAPDLAAVEVSETTPAAGVAVEAPAEPPRAVDDVASTEVVEKRVTPASRETTTKPPENAELPAVAELRQRDLLLPVVGIDPEELRDGFAEARSGGRQHQAIDIHAPRNRPVIAVEDGTIAKLSNGRRSGLAVFVTGPEKRFLYFYAHLEAFADGLEEGQKVRAGDLLGYVGTSGNAPPSAPHLHFAIRELESPRRIWRGTPINPYLVFDPE